MGDLSRASLGVCAKKGLYEELLVANLECVDQLLPFPQDHFSAVACVGVLSYVHAFNRLFQEWCRVTSPGGIVVFTHRQELWDGDVDGVRRCAEALEREGWAKQYISEPQEYM